MMTIRTLSLLALSLTATHAAAEDTDSHGGPGSAAFGIAGYDDDLVVSRVYSTSLAKTLRLMPEQGKETSLSLSATNKAVHFKEPADLLEKQLKGDHDIQERSGSVSVNQGLAIGSTIGLLAGANDSPLAKGKYGGLRIGQWFLEETLQTVLEFRRTILEQVTLDYVDTDGKRVITPADLEGSNVTLTMTHMTTPSTILRGAYSVTTRSDRPDAWSVSGEIRQFVTPTDSAVHVALTHYENIGEVEAKTTFGSVVSDTIRAEWHQKIAERMTGSLGYRYYLETEDPRAEDARDRRVGTDSIFGSWRWRFSDVAWTADSSEYSIFFNKFRSNAGVDGMLIGTSITLNLQ
jgi:hypothetical protein